MNLTDCRVGERLSRWKPILERWCAITEQWCEVAQPDRPWWHLEMSNAGLLAAAALQCGCASLVESSVPKVNGQTGRSDFWLKFPSGDESFCEFKICHLGSGPLSFEKLNQACRDAVAVNWPATEKIGVCLFMFHSDSPLDDAKIKAAIDQIWTDGRLDAVAWAFPECIRDIPGDGRILSPGVVMGMKLVGRQGSKDYGSHESLENPQ